MRKNLNVIAAYSIMMGLIILVGIFQSWNVALSIFNLCLISAVMTMGANIQWGYAGLIKGAEVMASQFDDVSTTNGVTTASVANGGKNVVQVESMWGAKGTVSLVKSF